MSVPVTGNALSEMWCEVFCVPGWPHTAPDPPAPSGRPEVETLNVCCSAKSLSFSGTQLTAGSLQTS